MADTKKAEPEALEDADWDNEFEEDEDENEIELEENVEKENHPAPKPKRLPKAKTAEKRHTAAKDDFGLREGTARSKAAALYSRPEGATLLEVKDELGAIHFNVLTKLKRTEENPDGFEVTTEKEAGNNNRTVTRYFLHKRSVD